MHPGWQILNKKYLLNTHACACMLGDGSGVWGMGI